MRLLAASRWLAPAVVLCLAGCGSSSGPQVSADLDDAHAIRDVLLAGGGGAAEESGGAEPTGFATIKGRFLFQGTVPAPIELQITKDVDVCRPGGKPVLVPQVDVDPQSKGVANVLIFLATKIPAGDPKWEHESYAATRDALLSGNRAFDQKNCQFLSPIYALRSTQTLEIVNSDPVSHNTMISPSTPKVQPLNVTIPVGGKVTWKPGGAAKQPIPVSCSIHPWMRAFVISRDDPYFAVSAKDGTFEINNVPAGVELEFRIWQGASKWIDGTVKLNGEDQKLKRGQIRVTLEPDQTLDWNFELPDSLF